jgi:uracil DNA glycosylase
LEINKHEKRGWRTLHTETIHKLFYFSANIIRVIKSEQTRRTGHLLHEESREIQKAFA